MTVQTPAAPTFPTNGKIAFTSNREGNGKIYLMNADGSGQTRLTDGADGIDEYPTWSPDGRKIAFVRNLSLIYVMNADGSNIRQIVALNPTGNFGTYGLSWSPDGRKLAFDLSSDIYIINVDGSNRVKLTNGIRAYRPSWSPDGTRIAFDGFSPAFVASNIYTMNANGGDVRQITNNGDYFSGLFSPDYSPSGAQIAFSLCLDDGNGSPAFTGISLINTDGTNPQFIPTRACGSSSKWAPDGTKLVFHDADVSNPSVSQIWVTNSDGSGLSRLTNTSSYNLNPDWQPLTPELGLIVTRSDDRNATCVSGDCSLREAVNAANASATDDTIYFASGLTKITLANEIVINNAGALTINGTGANNLTIDGGAGTNRIFYTNRATVTISGVTLTGGGGTGATNTSVGGAIYAHQGSLTLDGAHVTGNTQNQAGGGAFFYQGIHRISNSTFSGNSAQNCGGFALYDSFTALTVVNSTISGNLATSFEGGGFCNSGNTTLRNVTITNNTASNSGGGISSNVDATLNFSNTILAGNTATSSYAPEIRIKGIVTSAGGNTVGDSPGDSSNTDGEPNDEENTGIQIVYQPTDIRDTNPLLGALQNNGGATPTHALLAGSPLIDKGLNTLVSPLAPAFDQRGTGFPRISDGNGDRTPTVDIGAFEVQLGATGTRKTPFDFDGDGKADFSVVRPSNNVWYLLGGTAGYTAMTFGEAGDKLAPADYDRDGKTDVAVFRPSNGTWYMFNSATQSFSNAGWGQNGDLPVPADHDGDGKADLVVFRPSTNTWWTRFSADSSLSAVQFGVERDKPLIGDFDGDGKHDIGVFRPSDNNWYIKRTTDGFTVHTWGEAGDIPVPADYDGDGKTDLAIFRPSTGQWFRNMSMAGIDVRSWGENLDKPVAADYDGDVKADIAVFRPSNATWYIVGSTSGIIQSQFGTSEDLPTPAAYIY